MSDYVKKALEIIEDMDREVLYNMMKAKYNRRWDGQNWVEIEETDVRRILIVGIAKTGTTLLQRCFFSFKDVHIMLGEMNIDTLLKIKSQKSNLIGKRAFLTVFARDLPAKEIKRQLKLIRDNDIHLICTRRNREQTLKSDGGWVLPADYDAAILQQQTFSEYIDMFVDFHTLTTDPDEVQRQIANHFGLIPIHKFSEYPDYVPDMAFKLVSHNKLYRARKIGEAV